MPSSWIVARATRRDGRNKGCLRYLVRYRLGGRESTDRYAGSFPTKVEALARKRWIDGELAAVRVPDLRSLEQAPAAALLRDAAARWQASRVDVSDNTRLQHRSAVHAVLPTLGDRRVDDITAADVAELVATLTAKGRKRETVRKSLLVLAMIFDHAGVSPNPARDKITVKLPREQKAEIAPPSAEHVLAVHDVLPARHKLPLLVLDATGMRLGELEGLRWGDVDEQRGRWRVSRAVAKTGHGRWVSVPPIVFESSSNSWHARIAPRSAGCSRGSVATGSAPLSHGHARPPGCRRSPRTTSGTDGSACCISAVFRGRGSASTSGSATSP